MYAIFCTYNIYILNYIYLYFLKYFIHSDIVDKCLTYKNMKIAGTVIPPPRR